MTQCAKPSTTSAALSETEGLSDWRQSAYNQRCVKKAYRRVQQLKRSNANDPDKRAARQEQDSRGRMPTI